MSHKQTPHDQAFDPEIIATMDVALAEVRDRLRLAPHDERMASHVARTVIAMTQRGVRNPAALADAVMQQLEDESVVGACGEHFVDAAHAHPTFAQAAE